MKKTRVAHLIMMDAHNQDHGGVDSTLLTSLQTAWIIGGRALARSVKKACVKCRYQTKMLEKQQMAEIPEHLTQPSPIFSYVAVDLAGPFTVKTMGATRTTRANTGTCKVWSALFLCLQTKAIRIYIHRGRPQY